MSCISSNFSSFFLDSLNDPSEFAKYLSNGENKFSPFDDFQVFGTGGSSYNSTSQTQQQQLQLQQQYSAQQQNFNGNSGGLGSSNVAPYYSNNNNIISHNNNVHVNSVNNNASSSSSSGSVGGGAAASAGGHNHNNSEMYNSSIEANNFNQQQQLPHPTSQQQQQQHQQQQQSHQQYVGHTQQQQLPTPTTPGFHHNSTHLTLPPHHPHAHPHHALHPTNPAQGYPNPVQRWNAGSTHHPAVAAGATPAGTPLHPSLPGTAHCAGAQHFDGSFEFLKYLRHSNDYSATGSTSTNSPGDVNDASNGVGGGVAATPTNATQPAASLIDLDTSTSMKPRSARKAAALLSSASRAVAALDTTLDVFDHDSKHTIFDLQHHITNSSNSNESMDVSNLAFPNSHLNASNSNTSSEGAAAGSSDFSNLNAASNAPKPLVNFIINENFDVHPSHKVEEGIFQHMNKLPPKKKENLKQLGVRFTGQMTLSDKSIVVENFIKFCQEYEITDHRPFLSLNQSGLNKPEQIKFARYLGQGLPSFTLFCIYSNFKNLFCTKRTEIYTKDGYNLPYILDKTKRFLSNTTADLKNISQQQQQSTDVLDFAINNNPSMASVELNKCIMPKVLENFMIYENFDVHDTHRVEDGVCTHITRLPPKKQEILKQFGIQSNQSITHYEKYIIIENFIKFCNEYKISDHRPFLDFHESGLPKPEQVKFVRYLGQGLSNMTLNKIYLAFRDMLGINRIEKIMIDGYNLEMILKKKKKNLFNRMHTAVHGEGESVEYSAGHLNLGSEGLGII